MKFERNPTKEPKREPIAYIDVVGDLVIRKSMKPDAEFDDGMDAIYIRKSGNSVAGTLVGYWKWNPYEDPSHELLYDGDSITMIFKDVGTWEACRK